MFSKCVFCCWWCVVGRDVVVGTRLAVWFGLVIEAPKTSIEYTV